MIVKVEIPHLSLKKKDTESMEVERLPGDFEVWAYQEDILRGVHDEIEEQIEKIAATPEIAA